MKTYKIIEVFDSLQGEGANTGIPMTFVRFGMCNLECDFCDTNWKDNMGSYLHNDLIYDLKMRGPAWVCFTGGEPCIQLEVDLVKVLREVGIKVALETNGTMWNDAIMECDYVTISPKPALKEIDYQVERWFLSHKPQYQTLEVRFIVKVTTKQIPQLPILKAANHICLSPMFYQNAMLDIAFQNALELIKQNREQGWRVSVQTHKMLGVR